MITRRRFTLAGGIGLLVAHPLARGQPGATIRRVGWLAFGSEASSAELYAALIQGMRDLGWLEGKNVEYRFVYAHSDVNRMDVLASELIRQKAEVIVTGSAPTARALLRATKTIPIVMANVANPVGNGFVASLAKPGGNITGIANLYDEVLGKLIGVLHEVAPGARRVAILLNESNPVHPVFWAAAQKACTSLNLVALRVVADAPAQLDAAVGEIVRQRSQAVVVVTDGMYLTERAKLQELMQSTRLPVAYALREHVVAGGLLSYGANLAANYRHAATYVDKILKGAKPADLPVEQATKFELVINLQDGKGARHHDPAIAAAARGRGDSVITRRSVVLAGGVSLLVAHQLSRGQPAPTIRRVGWLSIGSEASPTELYAAFKQEDARSRLAGGEERRVSNRLRRWRREPLGRLAGELIRQNVDVIVVGNATTTRAVQRATKTIPIVMTARQQSSRQRVCRKPGQAGWQYHRDVPASRTRCWAS